MSDGLCLGSLWRAVADNCPLSPEVGDPFRPSRGDEGDWKVFLLSPSADDTERDYVIFAGLSREMAHEIVAIIERLEVPGVLDKQAVVDQVAGNIPTRQFEKRSAQ